METKNLTDKVFEKYLRALSQQEQKPKDYRDDVEVP